LKLRGILKRHFLRVGVIAVVVPLLIILAMQYRSLVELERTMPVARREYMRKYLVMVARDTYEFYRAAAEQTLNVPPRAFDQYKPRAVQSDVIMDHFKRNRTDAARRLFVATTAEVEERYYAIV
jgi:hypothetical protein